MIRYQITDGSIPPLADVDFIQIRNHRLSGLELSRLVRRISASVTGPVILVNDRIDIAIACGAGGVHLRDGALSPALVRGLNAARSHGKLIITVACHDEPAVARAAREGADYVLLAPIFNPLSKTSSGEPLGLETLRRITRTRLVPVIALGGVTQANAGLCARAGAAGIAGISFFDRKYRR